MSLHPTEKTTAERIQLEASQARSLASSSSLSVFKPYEKCESAFTKCLEQVEKALSQDELARKLLDDVLLKAGVKRLSEVIVPDYNLHAFHGGRMVLQLKGDDPEALLPGWPNLDAQGYLLVDPSPGPRIQLQIVINPSQTLIKLYSSIIHELIHAQSALARLGSSPIFDVLRYSSPLHYARTKIGHNNEESGTELEAFATAIAAVIRYRNRTQSSYEAFHTPVVEKYFDQKTAALINPKGLLEHITYDGGSLGYLAQYSEVFKNAITSELQYLRECVRILESRPDSIQGRAESEELSRIQVRIKKIEEKFAN